MFEHINIKSSFEDNKTKGVSWMLARCLFFSMMTIAFGMISKDIGPFQIFFFAIIVRFILLLPPLFIIQGIHIKTKYYKSYLIRALITTLGFATYIASLKNIDINEATAISYTTPLFTSIFATWLLGEKITIKRLFALSCGVIGAVVIIRPDLKVIDLGIMFAILAAMLWSFGDIVVKLQANTDEKLGTQLFWSTLLMLFVSMPFAIWEYLAFNSALPNYTDILWIGIAGLFILLTSIALFLSCKFSDRAFLMPFSFSKLIFTATLTYIMFSSQLKMSTAIGTAIIVASTVYLIKVDRAEKAIAN